MVFCSGLSAADPTQDQLRSLNLYDMKRYDDGLTYASSGLNRADLFEVDFNDSTIGYWTQSTDSSGEYYIIAPTQELNDQPECVDFTDLAMTVTVLLVSSPSNV